MSGRVFELGLWIKRLAQINGVPEEINLEIFDFFIYCSRGWVCSRDGWFVRGAAGP